MNNFMWPLEPLSTPWIDLLRAFMAHFWLWHKVSGRGEAKRKALGSLLVAHHIPHTQARYRWYPWLPPAFGKSLSLHGDIEKEHFCITSTPHPSISSNIEGLRWPGDSQRQSGRFTRTDSHKKTILITCERFAQSPHLRFVIFSAPEARFTKRGSVWEPWNDLQGLRRFARICESIRESGHLSWQWGGGTQKRGGCIDFLSLWPQPPQTPNMHETGTIWHIGVLTWKLCTSLVKSSSF